MQVRRLSELGGVEVEGVDLTARTPEVDREVRRLYDEHGLVCFRGQTFTKPQLIEAATPFGGPMINKVGLAPDPEAPGIEVISTRGVTGDVMPDDPDKMVGGTEWHTDQGYITTPNRGKILYAVHVPEEGGMTGFIDGQLTYKALPEAMRRKIENLHVVQSWARIHASLAVNRRYRLNGEVELADNRFPDVVYPIVHPHPLSGEPVLNVPPMWADSVVETPGEAGKALIAELVAHITQPRFQYWHPYRPGDAVIWDNWRFLHAAGGTLGRYVRTLWSIAIESGPQLGRTLKAA
jgi:taurine dioxygenase